jgi:hypothetical protein
MLLFTLAIFNNCHMFRSTSWTVFSLVKYDTGSYNILMWISINIKRLIICFVLLKLHKCKYFSYSYSVKLYSASHSRVAPENVGLQKEQKYNTFACHTCNEVRLCFLWIREKEVGNTKR